MKCKALIMVLAAATAHASAQTISFDSLAMHLPTIYDGDTHPCNVTFRFTNTGNGPLTIGKVMPTCGCTKVTHYPTLPLAAGKRDSIVVQYKSDRNLGTIDEPIFVYSDSDYSTPIAKLHVLGEIIESAHTKWKHLPASMGPLRLKRKEVKFGKNDVVIRIPCANTSPAPLRLKTTLLPPYVTFSTEPQTIKPNEEADIVLRIDRSKLPSIRPVKAAIIIDGVPCDLNSRRLNLTIE